MYGTVWKRTSVSVRTAAMRVNAAKYIGIPRQISVISFYHSADIVGPIPASNRFRYLFTVTDRSTRLLEATPIEDQTATTCVCALLDNWYNGFGLRNTSHPIEEVSLYPDYHPLPFPFFGFNPITPQLTIIKPNCMIERWHITLKAALIARCTNSDWTYHLPWVLLGIRTMP